MQPVSLYFFRCLMAVTALHFAGTAYAAPSTRPPIPVTQEYSMLGHVGAGDFSYFGIQLYHASLWTDNGLYSGVQETRPIVLTITYDKNIKAERLVKTTAKEWRRLKVADRDQRSLWTQQITNIWPDVAKGDSLTTLVDKTGITRFYANDEMIGSIDDPEFGPAFLSIWLDKKSRSKKLRRNLIGQDSQSQTSAENLTVAASGAL